MSKPELKTQLSTLLNENPETFVETLNEVFLAEWLKDPEAELLMINCFNPTLITLLKNRIEKEVGEKYVKIPSKFLLLVDTFLENEIIEKGTSEAKVKEFENNPKLLEGIKAVVEHYDKTEGENW